MGDQERKSYRGYGLAAVAGLGIGAALYYFMNNRQSEHEQPHTNSHEDDETERQNSFRSRSWTLEQCTICFENILEDSNHPTIKLPCGHNFHLTCASPWLQRQKTCPNCRKDLNA